MIDSLLDYPCVTAQPRASLMRGAALTLPVTPFWITDDKPSAYRGICDSHLSSHVIGSVSQRQVYQSTCLSCVFFFFFLRAEGDAKTGCVPRVWTMKLVSLQTTKTYSTWPPVRQRTDFSGGGVKKNTQPSAIIAALRSLVLIQKELFLQMQSFSFARALCNFTLNDTDLAKRRKYRRLNVSIM